jgi:pimeloyl-ACP methyl ester carboxylesterase
MRVESSSELVSGNGQGPKVTAGIDQALLERHQRYEDPNAGISEAFLELELGRGRTVAVLSRPLGATAPVGWVLCHSLGMEQIHLARLDVLVARAVAAAGFPVLRFHGQGYGDSELGAEAVGLSSHVAETEDAVRFLAAQPGVQQVGTMGARFGGMVAALVADRLDLPGMALWEPSVRGSRYMRDLLRRELLSKLAAGEEAGGGSEMERLRDDLASQGWADIRGFRLSRQAHDDISAADLTTDLTRFSGAALLVTPSRSDRVDAAMTKFSDQLRSLGARTEIEVIQDPFAGQFGQFRFQTVEGGRGKRDVQLELNEKIAAATVAWAARHFGASAPISEVQP